MNGDRNIDVAAIRGAAEKATPGPWHPVGGSYEDNAYLKSAKGSEIALVVALLDALDAARAEVERLTGEADEAIAQAERWSEDAAVLERERADIAERLAMDYEKQAQKCRAVTPNDYTEGSHDAYLSAARIAREVGKA